MTLHLGIMCESAHKKNETTNTPVSELFSELHDVREHRGCQQGFPLVFHSFLH
jgi:hypothetical protein